MALTELKLLDTAPSETFDRITRMAGRIFGLPIAAVSLTDVNRQWFKSRLGVDHWEIPRDRAPCAEVAVNTKFLAIPDMATDPYYKHSLLTESGIRFYAGAPLTTREGYGLGALCVLGTSPRAITEEEQAALSDLAAMVMSQIELQHALGRIDPASGLPNRHQFAEDFSDLQRDHPGEQGVCIVIDLSAPEDVSAMARIHGPGFLDDLLRSANRTLSAALPKIMVYHVAPTQFALLVTGVDFERVARRAGVTLMRLARAVKQDLRVSSVSPVIGLARFELGDTDARALLRMGHSATQTAREKRENVHEFDAKLHQQHSRRFRLLGDFPQALTSPSELELFFQPRVDIRAKQCTNVEALCRWTHPELGGISPGEFIPIVESSSIVHDLTDWVIVRALDQIAAWHRDGFDMGASVNVSAHDLNRPDFCKLVEGFAAKRNVEPRHVELEVTEGALVENSFALTQLKNLREMGFKIAIDDFGTGYSSLSYLERIPADIIKIDRSFVWQLGNGKRSTQLVLSMIRMAHDLGFRTVAEGIETPAQLAFVEEVGCDEGQGYLFSRPVPAKALTEWLGSGWNNRADRSPGPIPADVILTDKRESHAAPVTPTVAAYRQPGTMPHA